MANFTQSKFLSLTEQQQHRHLSDLLRRHYENDESLEPYHILASMIGFKSCPATPIEDLYHFHLLKADRRLKEHQFLKKNQSDRKEPLSKPIPVDVFLDNLRSAHNVGSITRTVETFGLGTIYGAGLTPAPSPKTAMGTEEWTTFQKGVLTDITSPLIAIELTETAIPYYEFDFPKSFTLAVGNEERGCSPQILEAAVHTIYIPMHGRKNSLNVANAFAIVAAEVARRHPLRYPS